MGYGEEQMRDLAATIERADCDSVVVATPIDLARVIAINKPNTRVEYSLQEIGRPNMDDILTEFVDAIKR
jgi:predicted GTPase